MIEHVSENGLFRGGGAVDGVDDRLGADLGHVVEKNVVVERLAQGGIVFDRFEKIS